MVEIKYKKFLLRKEGGLSTNQTGGKFSSWPLKPLTFGYFRYQGKTCVRNFVLLEEEMFEHFVGG